MENKEINSFLKTATHVFKEYGKKDPEKQEVFLGSLSFNKVEKNDTTFYNISKDGNYVVSFIERDDNFKCKVHDEKNLAVVKDSIYRVESLHRQSEMEEIKQRREAEDWVLKR